VASSKDSKNLLLAVAALVGFAAMLVWALAGPSTDAPDVAAPAEVAAAAADEPAQPAQAAGARAAAPAAPAKAAEPTLDVDLFAGPMPDFMTEAHARTLDKKWCDVTLQKKLYQFGQEHKDDARPQLLLAWDSMNREWYGIAVRMYAIAYRADKRSKHDPSMLRDLLFVAARHDRVEYKEASELIREAYGEEALPSIDEELATFRAQGNSVNTERLERLRDAITGG
jgi:hypothetical protein